MATQTLLERMQAEWLAIKARPKPDSVIVSPVFMAIFGVHSDPNTKNRDWRRVKRMIRKAIKAVSHPPVFAPPRPDRLLCQMTVATIFAPRWAFGNQAGPRRAR